jgi:hypothetical protein
MKTEIRDLLAYLLSLGTVICTWFLFFFWNGQDLLSGNDALLETLVYKDLLAVDGQWKERLFHPGIYGGALFHGGFGTLIISQILASLSTPVVLAYNLSHILTQSFIGFFVLLVVTESAKTESRELDWSFQVGTIVLAAFAPYLGWRIGYGHLNFTSGLLFPVVVVSLLHLSNTRNLSVTVLFISLLSLTNALSSLGQQIVFATPVFLGVYLFLLALPLWLTFPRRAWVVGLLLLASFLFVFPRLLEMARVAFGDEALRSLRGTNVAYQYITSQIHDWFGSIFWDKNVFQSRQNQFLWHETNYAFGPLAAIGLTYLAKNKKFLFWGLLTGLVALVLISMNTRPFSDLFFHVIPVFKGFRTPARIAMVFAFVFSLAALQAINATGNRRTTDFRERIFASSIALGIGLIVFWQEGAIRESVAWLVSGLFLVNLLWRDLKPLKVKALGLHWSLIGLSILAFCSLAAFKDRLLPFTPIEYFHKPAAITQTIVKNAPQLKSPMNRVVLANRSKNYKANTAWSLEISSLEGYLTKPDRFARFLAALDKTETDITRATSIIPSNSPHLPLLSQLYNIRYLIGFEGMNVVARPLENGAQPAWFSHRIQYLDSLSSVANHLKKAFPSEIRHKDFKEEIVLVKSGTPPDAIDFENCTAARVKNINAEFYGARWLQLDYSSPTSCPLTIAANHFSTHKAYVIDGAQKTELELVPAFGILTSAVVPKGDAKLVIETAPFIIEWLEKAFYAIAAILFLLACYISIRSGEGKDVST